MELVGGAKLELLAQRSWCAGAKPVEDLIVSLSLILHTDARLLQQVMRDVTSADLVLEHDRWTANQKTDGFNIDCIDRK